LKTTKIGQIIRVTHQPLVKVLIISNGKRNNPDPQAPIFGRLVTIQPEEFDQACSVGIVRVDGPIFRHLDAGIDQEHERVGNQSISLGGIAADAHIEQVVVVGAAVGFVRDGNEMVDGVEPGDTSPAFAKEAVDTTERELISKPGTVTVVIGVSLGSVPPGMRGRRILERHSHESLGSCVVARVRSS
jgi:hypothetical protein